MLGRSIHLEDDGTRPIILGDFNPSGARSSDPSTGADDGSGLDLEGSTVDEALDDSVSLWRRDLHLVIAKGDRLADLRKESLEREVWGKCVGISSAQEAQQQLINTHR